MNPEKLQPCEKKGRGFLSFILVAIALFAGILIGLNALVGAAPELLMKVSYEPGHEDASNIHSIEILRNGDATLHRYNKQARKMEAVLLKPKDAGAVLRRCEMMSRGDSEIRAAAMGIPCISVWISPGGGQAARRLGFSTGISEAPFQWVDRHARSQVGDPLFNTQTFEVEFAKQFGALLKKYE